MRAARPFVPADRARAAPGILQGCFRLLRSAKERQQPRRGRRSFFPALPPARRLQPLPPRLCARSLGTVAHSRCQCPALSVPSSPGRCQPPSRHSRNLRLGRVLNHLKRSHPAPLAVPAVPFGTKVTAGGSGAWAQVGRSPGAARPGWSSAEPLLPLGIRDTPGTARLPAGGHGPSSICPSPRGN